MNVVVRVLLGTLMWLLRFLLIHPICYLIAIGGRKKCPPMQNPLLMHSAKTLAQMIRTRQVRCEDVVQAYISRAYEVNKVVNAIVEPRYVEALQEAKAVDKMLDERGDQLTDPVIQQALAHETPLLGVPITVKESIAVEGMSNDAGRQLLERRIPASEDADVVQLLKAAGAIIILVSNTPELCMFWETYNQVTGLTRNPYDTRRTVGGSSGGEAALLAAGASVIGIGSDIGGSLRLPASYTGVFGHKPSPRFVSIHGHVPECDDSRYPQHFTLGPMVRYAEDLPLALSVLVDPQHRRELRLDQQVSMTDIKFYYMENDCNSHLSSRVDRDTITQMRKFITHLQTQYGIKAQKAHMELMKNSFEISILVMLQLDGLHTPFYDEVNPKRLIGVWSELFRYLTCRSYMIFPIIYYGLLKKLSQQLRNRCSQANKDNAQLAKEFQELLGDNGVLLMPTFTGPAHLHYEMFGRMFDLGYLLIFNALGLPVSNCPVGYSSTAGGGGLPLGLQVIAAPGNDRLTIAVAAELERVFGGWRPPPSVNPTLSEAASPSSTAAPLTYTKT